PPPPHRRPGAADRRDLGARAQARGAQRRAPHARVGRGADPRVPAQTGREGYGEDLRRADERDLVRHRGPPRRARGGGRRAAGARPRRRRDRARRAEAEAHAPRERRGARAATSGVEATAALVYARLRPPLPRPRAPGERGGGLRLPAGANPGSRGGHGGAVAQLDQGPPFPCWEEPGRHGGRSTTARAAAGPTSSRALLLRQPLTAVVSGNPPG